MTDLINFVTTFFKVVWRTLLVAGLLYAAATLWSIVNPTTHTVITRDASFEDIIIQAQIQRSHEIDKADVLIVGDSSALMGIDVLYLEKLLGSKRRIQSLATIANVSPKGHLKLVENYFLRHGAPEILILQLNPIALADSGEVFSKKYENWVLNDSEPLPSVFLRGPEKIYRDGLALFLKFPMRHEYAKRYGWPQDVLSYLYENKGSMVDPGPKIPWTHDPHYFTVGLPYLHKFMQVKTYLDEIQPKRTLLVFTPNIESKNSPMTSLTRRLTYDFLIKLLGLSPQDQLSVPEALPDDLFISTHHLNEEGRRVYTEALAKALLKS